MSDWRPGFRHQVKGYGPDAWQCVNCGHTFPRWPSDDEECPGPRPEDD